MQIQELQDQLNRLQGERDDLQARLTASIDAGDRARQMALSLQQQLDDCRRDLAAASAAPASTTPMSAGEGWKEYGDIAWVDLEGDILFDSGKDSLKKEGEAKVQQVADRIRSDFPNRQVFVIGHTDSDPIKKTAHLYKDNLDLSLNRAATVTRELQKLGIDAQKLIAAGQGEHNPRDTNATKEGKQNNRRVEIVAVNPR